MADFNQTLITQPGEFMRSLNEGMLALSTMEQFDFFGATAVASSKASEELGIEAREIYRGNTHSEFFIRTITNGGSTTPQLKILAFDNSGFVFVDYVIGFQGNPQEGIGSHLSVGMATKTPSDQARLVGPFPAVFAQAGEAAEIGLMQDGGANLGPGPMRTAIGVINELHALMEDLRAA